MVGLAVEGKVEGRPLEHDSFTFLKLDHDCMRMEAVLLTDAG